MNVLAVITLVGFIFAAGYGIFVGGQSIKDGEKACAAAGGVQVKAYNGFICIRVEVIK